MVGWFTGLVWWFGLIVAHVAPRLVDSRAHLLWFVRFVMFCFFLLFLILCFISTKSPNKKNEQQHTKKIIPIKARNGKT
jgi:uncharacterized membrane protein YhaH (DUF805 family)